MNLLTIQTLTENLAASLRQIEKLAIERERRIAEIEKEFDDLLSPHVAAFTGRRAALKAAIQVAPELFKRPRTYVFAGIKVGYQKQKGKIVIKDEAATIEKMTELLGDDEAAHYLNVATTVNKTSINSMPADIMKKLGIELTADTDAVLFLNGRFLELDQIAVILKGQSKEDANG